uniref:VPS37 C-terminal domain-containing protein n=1 Tax=Parastrongyloides trichosuri TaxID=131310 RepID=A0A0N4ZLW2_PARTI
MMSQNGGNLKERCLSKLMANIKNMSYNDLDDLFNNDDYQATLVETLPEIKAIPKERETLLVKLRDQASKNIVLEPEINMARDKLLRTHQKATEILTELKNKKSQLDELGEERSLQSINNLLISAQHEAEDTAEAIAKQFTQGDISLEDFKKLFIIEKSKALSRRLKKEKLEELIREQEHIVSMNKFQQDPIFNQGNNAAPYPTGSVFPQVPIPGRPLSGQGPITPYPAGSYSGGVPSVYQQTNRNSFW